MHQKIRDAFAQSKIMLPKAMKYTAQVIWVLDPQDAGMMANGRTLHAKRAAAGEVKKSQIIYGSRPEFDKAFLDRGDIRLYVCGHGVACRQNGRIVKFGIKTGTPLNDAHLKDVKEFWQMLDQVIQQMPEKRVRRISLDMCNSAGIESEISLRHSFAAELAICCGESTTDVTGRRGVVRVVGMEVEQEGSDDLFKSFGLPNVFHTFREVDPTGILGNSQSSYVYGARKRVHHDPNTTEDEVTAYGTYVFTRDGKCERKRDKAT